MRECLNAKIMNQTDETEYWLEIINEANLSDDTDGLISLMKEANEITRIMTKTKNSLYNKR